MKQAVQNPEQYISDNQTTLKEYMLFKQSDEYKESPAYKVQEQLKAFNRESGYNDVFIPAMKKLSPSYQKYHESLNQLNDVFLKTHLNDQIE